MKKGFTLVEVISSLALILLLTVIIVTNVIKTSDENKYEMFKSKIDLALTEAENYGYDRLDQLSSSCKAVTIGDLITLGYLNAEENGRIYDPRTNESMNEIWICVTYTDNKINTYLRDEVE